MAKVITGAVRLAILVTLTLTSLGFYTESGIGPTSRRGIEIVQQSPIPPLRARTSNVTTGPFKQVSSDGVRGPDGEFACALSVNGRVACWGSEHVARLRGRFRQISARLASMCALRRNAKLSCWLWLPPRAFTQPGRYNQVSVGPSTCAVDLARKVRCWGANNVGNPTRSAVRFRQVSAGGLFNCGLLINLRITCWGESRNASTSPPRGRFTQVSAGGNFACGLRVNHHIVCWSDARSGATRPPAGYFVQVSVSGTNQFGCGLRRAQIITCWGSAHARETTPPRGRFTNMSVGGDFGCAVRLSGSLACWGGNAFGQASPPP